MRLKFTGLLFLLLLGLQTADVNAEREVVDKIVAVVGDEVILVSELANQIQLIAFQTGQQPKSEAEMKKFQMDILDQMVSDRLFLLAAKDDTTISIRDEEIEQMLDDQVTRIAQNYPTYDDFLNALASEGLTVRELKKKYRMDVENQLLKQRFINKKLYTISVSRHEVEEFYDKFADSIPSQPEGVKLAHILLTYKASQKVIDSVQALAQQLRKQVLDGADFAELSKTYSVEGAKENGGELGYLSKDDVVPEFARAAFNLNIGDISGAVQTQFGIHVIKCEDINGDRYKLRHILLGTAPSYEDSLATRQLADSLVKECWNGADFALMAKTYSDDNETRAQGGELGWFAAEQMPPEFVNAVSGWKEAGEIRGPIESRFGLHILKLLEYQEGRKYTLESDYDQLKELARQDKTGQIVDEWIAELKQKTYISYQIEL